MINYEAHFLYSEMCYEEYSRRTQHILKAYALAKLLWEQKRLLVEDLQILLAAAILHDIAVKPFKEHCRWDVCQDSQKQAALLLAASFFKAADYLFSYISRAIDLVICHHDCDDIKNIILRLLIEADFIAGFYETLPDQKKQNI